MRSAAGVVAESGVRALGPLPRRAAVFNSVRLTADAQRVFLTSKADGSRRSNLVVDNVVTQAGQGGVPEGKPHDWYRIRNVSADEADILIYDEISWFGIAAEEFVSELRQVQASQLNVRINSPGGSVFDGITIANAIMAHPANVTVYVDGLAASIASVIALAGDKVVMMPRSQFMIHDASGLCIGNAADMRDMVDLLDKQSDNIAGAYADRAGGTPEEWRARMQAETWYSAEEAVEAGLADEVAEPRRRRGEEEPEEQPAPAMRHEQLIRAAFRYKDREHAPDPVLQAKAEAPAPTAEMRGEHGPELVDLPDGQRVVPLEADAEPTAPEPAPIVEADPWAALTAHLTTPAPDPWAALVAHLTDTTTSSSAATTAHA